MHPSIVVNHFQRRDLQALGKHGNLTYPTTKGFFIPSNLNHLAEAFPQLIKEGIIDISKSFLDAGAGDGRVVALATTFGLRAFGIEFERELVKEAKDIFRGLKISDNLITEGDFTDEKPYKSLGIPFTDFSTIYNFANSVYEIAEKIIRESRRGTVFLFYDTDRRATPFQGLTFAKTIKMVDSTVMEGKDLPLIVDYLHLYGKS